MAESGWIDRVVIALAAAGLSWWLKGNEAHDAELARRLDDAVAELSAIEAVAVAVWGKAEATDAKEAGEEGTTGDPRLPKMSELEGRLHRLAVLIDFAGARVPSFEQYGTGRLLTDLRIACTNDGLGAETELPPAPLRIKTILIRATDLVLCLRSMQRDVLPRSWMSRWRRRLRLPTKGPKQNDRQYWDH